ncbi:hypothetical protein GOQ29_14390 [Clostridium sp. D2Q-14]|uniref:hypothetical protein n=1 Tax=Anaeromonas gelatinilytica TaxID=2683194 RepID=UPI00193C5D37|nr:hypothetical protein [Anaeromonas gelatinilytica]MBS4536806.1 hypothetical protein [Anaeromonas gelatinilytica]
MAQIIEMSKHYKCKPSEILNIDDDYLAYCFDEVAFYLWSEAIDKEGKVKWNRIKWKENVKKDRNNKDIIKFMQAHS